MTSTDILFSEQREALANRLVAGLSASMGTLGVWLDEVSKQVPFRGFRGRTDSRLLRNALLVHRTQIMLNKPLTQPLLASKFFCLF